MSQQSFLQRHSGEVLAVAAGAAVLALAITYSRSQATSSLGVSTSSRNGSNASAARESKASKLQRLKSEVSLTSKQIACHAARQVWDNCRQWRCRALTALLLKLACKLSVTPLCAALQYQRGLHVSAKQLTKIRDDFVDQVDLAWSWTTYVCFSTATMGLCMLVHTLFCMLILFTLSTDARYSFWSFRKLYSHAAKYG